MGQSLHKKGLSKWECSEKFFFFFSIQVFDFNSIPVQIYLIPIQILIKQK